MEENEPVFNDNLKDLLEKYFQPAIQNAHRDGFKAQDILAGLFVTGMAFSMVLNNSNS